MKSLTTLAVVSRPVALPLSENRLDIKPRLIAEYQ